MKNDELEGAFPSIALSRIIYNMDDLSIRLKPFEQFLAIKGADKEEYIFY